MEFFVKFGLILFSLEPKLISMKTPFFLFVWLFVCSPYFALSQVNHTNQQEAAFLQDAKISIYDRSFSISIKDSLRSSRTPEEITLYYIQENWS